MKNKKTSNFRKDITKQKILEIIKNITLNPPPNLTFMKLVKIISKKLDCADGIIQSRCNNSISDILKKTDAPTYLKLLEEGRKGRDGEKILPIIPYTSNKIEIKKTNKEFVIKVPLIQPMKRYFLTIQKKAITRTRQLAISNPQIPSKSGTYILLKNNKIVYVGTAKNIRDRISQHSHTVDANNCAFVLESDTLTRYLLEKIYILLLDPPENKPNPYIGNIK